MQRNKVETRHLSKDFPKLKEPNGQSVVISIEIDVDSLSNEEKYQSGGWENLIRSITAEWIDQHAYNGTGTIWQWSSPSVNFGHAGYSMFYAVLGMPKPYNEYLRNKMKILKKCIRVNSDCVVPSREDGWDVMCHIEDHKAWEPLDPSLWQETTLTKESQMSDNEIVVYQNSKMDTIYYDSEKAAEGDDCEVKLGNHEIIISYAEGNGFGMYKGKELSPGHFSLEYPEKNGKASLHMFSDSKILEGFWVEDGARGFWRIHLV